MSKQNKTKPSTTCGQNQCKSPAGEAVELSVYQQGGQAVVRESRGVRLQAGVNQVYLEGLPTQYQLNSLTVLDYEGADGLSLGPISYRAANLDKLRILQGSVGTAVTIREYLANGRANPISGKLLAVFGNEVAVERNDNGHTLLVSSSQVELCEGVPASLSATPSLVMSPAAKVPGDYRLRMLYEAGGFAWSTRYSAFYDESKGVLTRFEAAVALTNQSGARFQNARVKLVAGSNYGRQSRGGYGLEMASFAPVGGARAMKAMHVSDAAVESVGESKMYTLPEAVTIGHEETQQVTLFLAKDVPVKREYFLQPEGYYDVSGDEDAPKTPAYIRLRLKNDKANSLGVALPAGEVNIFQADSSGSQQKTGSANVGHVSDGEKFKVEFGPCSDIKAQRRLVATRELEGEQPKPFNGTIEPPTFQPMAPLGAPEAMSSRQQRGFETAMVQEPQEVPTFHEEDRELVVYNYKNQAVEVHFTEEVPSNAEVTSLTDGQEFNFANGTSKMRVKVDANGTATLRYRVRWQTN